MEVLLGIVIILVMVLFFSVIGAGVMSFFGFTYDSMWSFIVFFFSAAVLQTPLDLLNKGFGRIFIEQGFLPKRFVQVSYFIIDMTLTYATMKILDHFMTGITAPDISLIVFGLVIAIFGGDNFKDESDELQ